MAEQEYTSHNQEEFMNDIMARFQTFYDENNRGIKIDGMMLVQRFSDETKGITDFQLRVIWSQKPEGLEGVDTEELIDEINDFFMNGNKDEGRQEGNREDA